MSETAKHSAAPDSGRTSRQAAALAEHLQRLGVEWLPVADPEAVERLRSQFEPSDESQTAGSAGVESDGVVASTPATPTAKAAVAKTAGQVGTGRAESSPPTAAASFSLDAPSADASGPYPGDPLPVAQRETSLARYDETVAACRRCEVLSKCRKQTVFGEGNLQPRVVFFGEGPGREEDLSGRPFVGKAGQLLTKMIQACTFAREDVYIMNTIKCRPPNNRNPEPTEVENCREYFEAQLQILRPEYIVCLGLVSAQALLRNKLSVGMMRGKFHRYFDSKVVVTYHPAYLLRTPAAKKAAWDDLQMMLRDAGLLK